MNWIELRQSAVPGNSGRTEKFDRQLVLVDYVKYDVRAVRFSTFSHAFFSLVVVIMANHLYTDLRVVDRVSVG